MSVIQDRTNRELHLRRAPTRKGIRFDEPKGSIGSDHWMEDSADDEDNVDTVTMLMSPPPEEILRSARGKHVSDARLASEKFMPDSSSPAPPSPSFRMAKRKRTRSGVFGGQPDNERGGSLASTSRLTMDATPSPKARKLSNRHVAFASEPRTPTRSTSKLHGSLSPSKRNATQSPHASNPHADYILPGPSDTREQVLSRRRTTTPIPYEPPSVVFTPPREVTYTPAPSMSKSSKRKSLPRLSLSKTKKLVLQIKKELPEIDLNEPMPPASPSDDPLLLHGQHRSHHKRRTRKSAQTQTPIFARETPSMSSSPTRMPDMDQSQLLGASTSLDFGSGYGNGDFSDDGPIPIAFNFDLADGVADWTDDEGAEEDFDQSGEYTGKFKAFLVPTKADPPSSCTKARMDAWGRPVSPFPKIGIPSPVPEVPAAVGPSGWSSSPAPEATIQSSQALPAIVGPPRSAQPIIADTDTPAVGFDDTRSSSLPPSSPIRNSDDTVMPHDPHVWRSATTLLSDGPNDEHAHAVQDDEDQDHREALSDLPIADYDDEEVHYPPETPLTDFHPTPRVLVSDSAVPGSSPVVHNLALAAVSQSAPSASLTVEEQYLRAHSPTPLPRRASGPEANVSQPAVAVDFTPAPSSDVIGTSYLGPGRSVSPNPFAPSSDGYGRHTLRDSDDPGAGWQASSSAMYQDMPVVRVEPPSEEQPPQGQFGLEEQALQHQQLSSEPQHYQEVLPPSDIPHYQEELPPSDIPHHEDLPPSDIPHHEEELPPSDIPRYEDNLPPSDAHYQEELPPSDVPHLQEVPPSDAPSHQEQLPPSDIPYYQEELPHSDAQHYQSELPPSDVQPYPENAEEIEDAESVVRELSQEPDYDSDDEIEGPAVAKLPRPTHEVSAMVPQSSPHNPFRVYSPGHVIDEGIQTFSPSPPRAGPSVPAASASTAEASAESTITRRGPPRAWPPTPADADTTIIDVVMPPIPRVAVDGTDDDEYVDEDPSVVIITSADPKAAARAAAILKLHKYDCLDKSSSADVMASVAKRRDSSALLKSVLKSSRRKTLGEASVQKSSSAHKRHSIGGVIGNRVIIPGSPSTTLPELLKEAEESVLQEEDSFHAALHTESSSVRPKTPAPDPNVAFSSSPVASTSQRTVRRVYGPREWSKDDWKLLDSCYTDERLALTRSPELLAPADRVDLEKVVDRFATTAGGEDLIKSFGEAWTRENILKRARALRRKQTAGKFAPPSGSTPSRSAAGWTPSRDVSMFMSPNRPLLQELVSSRSSGDGPAGRRFRGPSPLGIPLHESLDVPRSSPHHMAEDPASTSGSSSSSQGQPGDAVPGQRDPDSPERSFNADADSSHITSLLPGPASLSFAGKVKGLIFSYLPRAVRRSPASNKVNESVVHKGLPLPPPEILHKPRGPVTTPVSKPIPKAAAPKELVRLHPVPAKPSMIPRPAPSHKPHKWANLHPVPQRPATSMGIYPEAPPRDRRNSTASVRDLVQSFESMSEVHAAERESLKQLELRRKKSVQEWAKARAGPSKPVWKP